MGFSVGDVRASFDETTFARGLGYARSGRVLRLDVSADGRSIEATVRGSSAIPYEVAVAVRPRHGRVYLHGSCDCPVAVNCKHCAAAAILAAEG
ncbi:MAG: hypothetical protein JO199_10075, partial [Candidatus Eremiobacteraeota bacterium]|nr:hypothetical protein [Candidatus Eremiobacteraeota bacterium]